MTPPDLPSDPDPDPEDRSDLDSWFRDETDVAEEQPRDKSPSSKRRAVLGAFAAALIAAALAFTVVLATHGSSSSSAATATTNSSTNGQNGSGGPGGFAGRGGGGTVGSISAVSGSTLTIKDFNGQSTKVATTSKTTVTKSVSGALSDINVGDHVTVVGTGSTTQLAAQRITDTGTSATAGGTAGGAFPGGGGGGNGNGAAPPGGTSSFSFATGTVKSVNESTFVVASSSGSTSTVTTSSSTTVTKQTAGTVSDLSVGEQVVVTGTTNNGVVTATSIREGAVGGFGGRNGGGPGQTPPSTGIPS